MSAAFDAQAAVRMDAEQLDQYMRELFSWSKEMKAKEGSGKRQQTGPSAATAAPAAQGTPPVNRAGSGGSQRPSSAGASSSKEPRHPAAHTYDNYRAKWERFDVDAALAEADSEDASVADPGSNGSSRGADRPTGTATPGKSRGASSAPVDIPAARVTVPVAATGAAGVPAPGAAAPTSAEGWKDAGNAHFKAGRFQQAEACYSRSLELAPTCLAHANRALARLKLGRPAEAEADCAAALALDLLYVKAYQRRWACLGLQGCRPSRKCSLACLSDAAPAAPAAASSVSAVLFVRVPASLHSQRPARCSSPPLPCRGAARHQLGNLLGAVEDCEQVLRLEPNNKQAAAERAQRVAELLAKEGLSAPSRFELLPLAVAAAPVERPTAATAGPAGEALIKEVSTVQRSHPAAAAGGEHHGELAAAAAGTAAQAPAAAALPMATIQVLGSSSRAGDEEDELIPDLPEEAFRLPLQTEPELQKAPQAVEQHRQVEEQEQRRQQQQQGSAQTERQALQPAAQRQQQQDTCAQQTSEAAEGIATPAAAPAAPTAEQLATPAAREAAAPLARPAVEALPAAGSQQPGAAVQRAVSSAPARVPRTGGLWVS